MLFLLSFLYSLSHLSHFEVLLAFTLIGEVRESVSITGLKTFQILGTGLQVGEFGREMFGVAGFLELGTVGWLQTLALNFLPVDALEPGMHLDIFSVSFRTSKTVLGVLHQQVGAKVSGISGQELVVHFRVTVLNVLVQLLAVFGVEGGQTDEHLVDNGTEGPPVGSLSVSLSLQDFW